MHPEVRQAGPVAGLGLGDLVGVMHGHMVLAAAVDVEERAQVLGRHRGALDVPAGEADAPGARPFHLPCLAGRAELPEREVGRTALLPDLDSLARAQPPDVQPREMAVVGELRGIEVDPVRRPVREPLGLDTLDERDLLGDVVGGSAPDGRLQDVESPEVVLERPRVQVGDLPGGLPGAPRARLDLVLPRIGIRREVPDVGDVHDVLHRVAVERQQPAEHVLEEVGPQVPDVRVVIDGGAAGVQAHLPVAERLELAHRARPRVVELDGGHGSLAGRRRGSFRTPDVSANLPYATGEVKRDRRVLDRFRRGTAHVGSQTRLEGSQRREARVGVR